LDRIKFGADFEFDLNFKFALLPPAVACYCPCRAPSVATAVLPLASGSHAPSTQVLSPRSGRIMAISTRHLPRCYRCRARALKHLSQQRKPPKLAPSLLPTTAQALSNSFCENLSSEPQPPLLPTRASRRPAATLHHPPH
jgi:hypothetical protein